MSVQVTAMANFWSEWHLAQAKEQVRPLTPYIIAATKLDLLVERAE